MTVPDMQVPCQEALHFISLLVSLQILIKVGRESKIVLGMEDECCAGRREGQSVSGKAAMEE